ncbi:MAG: glycosyltransferase [Aquificae bacterium]|nr:glycosyltransferase [Aquificota bacterium]
MDWELKKRLLLKDLPNIEKPTKGKIYWVHTPSVGEFVTVRPLLEEIKKRNHKLVITYFSPRAKEFMEKQSLPDLVYPLPLPVGFLLKKFLERIKPDVFLLVESDRFPSLLRIEVEEKYIVNARLSDKSFRFLKRFAFIFKPALETFDLIICKDEETKEKFLSLGIDKKKLTVCGNLKVAGLTDGKNLNITFSKGGKIFVAGSTHHGEEEIILKAFKEVKKNIPNLILVLVPRHIERVEKEIKPLLEKEGLKYTLRSSLKEEPFKGDVLVVDTLGELKSFYKIADVAFVGGTLVPVGGHNLLEPAYFGKPTIFGPYTWKFVDLEKLLKEWGLGFPVKDERELKETLLRLLKNPPQPKGDIKKVANQILDCYLEHILI